MRPGQINCLVLFTVTLMVVLVSCSKEQAKPKDPSLSSKGTTLEQAKGGAPKIVTQQPVYDFGRVEQDNNVEHVFKIQNKGTGVLQIDRAAGS